MLEQKNFVVIFIFVAIMSLFFAIDRTKRGHARLARTRQNERERKLTERYSEPQCKIIAACKKPTSLEDIITITNLSFEQVQSELFSLQLDGIVSQDFTGMWSVF